MQVMLSEATAQSGGTVGDKFVKAFKEKYGIEILKIEPHENDTRYGTGEVWFTIIHNGKERKVRGSQSNYSWSMSSLDEQLAEA